MYSHSINCSGGNQTRLFFELLLVYAKSGRGGDNVLLLFNILITKLS
jgi:hypothetical protein